VPDDACSACKSCQPGPDSPDQEAVRDGFNLKITEAQEELTDLQEAQELELEELAEQKDREIQIIQDQIKDIQKRIDAVDAQLAADPGNEALIQEKNQLELEKVVLQEYGFRIESEYREDLTAMEEAHKVAQDYWRDVINDLREARDERLKVMKNRGVCKNKKVGAGRPCYCPAYVDEDTQKVVDDGRNRECYLCNTDNGDWEYTSDLCTLSCERCITCDNGVNLCATVTLPEKDAGDICLKARKKAERRCQGEDELPKLCPYPREACQVDGPVGNANFSSDTSESGAVQILQGGQQKLQQNNGIVAYIYVLIAEGAQGTFFLRASEASLNGGAIKPLLLETSFTISGSDFLPEPKLTGKPKVTGPKTVDQYCQADTSEVVSSQGDAEVYEFRWFADNEPIRWTNARYPVPLVGEQHNPEGKYGEGALYEEEQLLLAPEDENKFIQVAIRSRRDNVTPDESRELKFSDPYGVIKAAPLDYSQGSISIFGSPDEGTYSALVVDLSELEALYYPKYFPILVDWIAADTGQSVGASDHVFLREWAENRIIYAVATIFDEGDPITFISQSIGPIGRGGPPEAEPNEGESNVTASLSGALKEGSVLEVSYTSTLANGKSAGPFYSWEVNGELIYGIWNSSTQLNQATVGNFVGASVVVYDRYGTPWSGTDTSSGTVENVPSDHTGSAWLLGPDEPAEGATLTVFNNIDDPDGLGQGVDGEVGGLRYQWRASGLNIEGATESFLKLNEGLQLRDKMVWCVVWWETDFGVEKEVQTNVTPPILPGSKNFVLSAGPNVLDVASGQAFPAPIYLNGDGDVGVTKMYHEWFLYSTPGSSGISLAGESLGAPAFAGPLATAVWNDEDQLEETCPKGWDCFSTSTNPYSGELAPLGSKYVHKCPYPGYPELTYEESLEQDCKLLCQDYCYPWTVTLSANEVPVLDDNTVITGTFKGEEGSIIYNLETCAPHPDGEEACPPNFKKNYTSIWRLAIPEINVWECSCDTPIGEQFTIEATTEWSVSTAGYGPWSMDPEWGIKYPACGVDKPFPPEGIAGQSLPFGGVPCVDGDDIGYFFYLFGCEASFGTTDRGEEVCSRRRMLFGGGPSREIKKWAICGQFSRDAKPNPQRQFIVEDRDGALSTVAHGYSMWPFVYRTWFINGVSDQEPYDTNDVSEFFRPRIFNPGVPEESWPPRCAEAPTQVAYYSIADNTFFSTLATYKEIVGETWYGCFVDGTVEGAICESCAGSIGFGCEIDPDHETPIQLSFVRGARFIELQEGDDLFAGGLSVLTPPGIPEREPTNGQKTPAVVGPRNASYSNGNSRTIARMEGTANGEELPALTAWRFSSNKSNTDPTGNFKISTSSGVVTAAIGAIAPGSYSVQVQGKFLALWSKSFTLTISVVA
jgi:hypothetical protein